VKLGGVGDTSLGKGTARRGVRSTRRSIDTARKDIGSAGLWVSAASWLDLHELLGYGTLRQVGYIACAALAIVLL
jgi:hypothetical protein